MTEPHPHPNTTEPTSSQASKPQEAARKRREHDYRTIPGGHPSRATAALGMESLDRSITLSTALGPARFEEGQERQAPPPPRGQS